MSQILRFSVCSLFAFLFSLPTLQAQEGMSFGLQVAPTVNFGREFVNDRSIDSLAPGASVGVRAGLQAHYGLTDNFGAYTGLFYRLTPMNIGPEDEQQRVRLSYIELPIAAQFTSFDLGNSWYLKARAGMSIDIRAGAILDEGESRLKVGDQFAPIDFSLLAYIGLEYDLLEAGYLDFGIGYHHGFVNIYRNDAGIHGYGDNDVELRLSRLAFNVGFIFR